MAADHPHDEQHPERAEIFAHAKSKRNAMLQRLYNFTRRWPLLIECAIQRAVFNHMVWRGTSKAVCRIDPWWHPP